MRTWLLSPSPRRDVFNMQTMNRDVPLPYARALPSVSSPIASRWTNTRSPSPRDCQSPPSRVHFRKFIARQTHLHGLVSCKTKLRACALIRDPILRRTVPLHVSTFPSFDSMRKFPISHDSHGEIIFTWKKMKYFYRSRQVIVSLKSGSWRILEMDEFLHARVLFLDRNVLFLEIYRTSNLRRR